MIWRSISFDWPGAALWLFLSFAVVGAYIVLFRYRKQKLRQFADESLLKVLVERRLPLAFWTKVVLSFLVVVCAVLALMQPKGNERYAIQTSDSTIDQTKSRMLMHYVIFLIDASASMAVNDLRGRSRLDVAKEIADGIVSRLHGENVALFAFTSATMQIVPLTTDYLFTRLMLREIAINEDETSGTDLKQALETVHQQYFASASSIPKTMVLFTDGGDTHYESLEGQAQSEALEGIVAPISNTNNLRVLVVGLGTKQGGNVPKVQYEGHAVHSAVDLPLLRKISVAGNGRLFLSEDLAPMLIAQDVASEISQQGYFETNDTSVKAQSRGSQRIYDLFFQYPLGIAIAALALFLLIPDTRKKKLLILTTIFFSSSFSVEAAVRNLSMLQAEEDFEAGNYVQAISNYEDLLQENLKAWEKAIILYDIGTVLLKEQKWQEALNRFHEAGEFDFNSPQFKQRLTNNIALVSLVLAEKQIEPILNISKANYTDYHSAFSSFQNAKDDLDEAFEAACVLQAAKGASECLTDWELSQMQTLLSNLQASLIKGLGAYYNANFAGNDIDQRKAMLGLLVRYDLALLQYPLKVEMLNELVNFQKNVGEILMKNGSEDISSFNKSSEYLSVGIAELKKKQPIQASMWVEMARNNIWQFYIQLNARSKDSAEAILKSAIDNEQFALRLNRIWKKAEKHEKMENKTSDLLEMAQNQTIRMTERFSKAVKEQQSQEFALKGSEGDLLQHIPWDAIISLFLQGQEAAAKANTFLASNNFFPNEAAPLQTKAIDKWTQALNLIKKPRSQSKMPEKQPESESSQPKPEPSPTQNKQSSDLQLNDVLRLLQDMEEDDRSKPELKNIPVNKGENRPW